MKKSRLLSGVLGVVVGMGLLAVTGRAWAQSSRPAKSTSKTKTESYMVIEVGGEYRAIRTSALKDEKKRIEDDYKKALDLWQDEVKVDSKAKRPTKATVIVKKGGFKTQKGADEYLAKLKEEDQEAGKDSKEGKESTNPAGKKVVF
jgi:hypothetical protein